MTELISVYLYKPFVEFAFGNCVLDKFTGDLEVGGVRASCIFVYENEIERFLEQLRLAGLPSQIPG